MTLRASDFFAASHTMSEKRKFPLAALLLLPALLLMLDGLWAGLQRMGWTLPHLHPGLAALHGPLMIAGFLGTLISLERAAALRVKWFYLAPLCSAVGTLLIVSSIGDATGIALITIASALLFVMMLYAARQHPAPFTYLLAAGAAMWLLGNGLWLAGLGVANAVLWWSGFLILTIVGERLELSRLLNVPRRAQIVFWAGIALFGAGVVSDTIERVWFPDAALYLSSRLVGIGMLALAVWLARYDIARRNLRQTGLTRFIAVCLMSGYVWLGIGGALRLFDAGAQVGLYYDAMLHAVFIGFVFGMIFAHAPIILPSILMRPLPYAPIQYAPWFLVQIGLTMRMLGDLTVDLTLRQWGGMVSALGIAFFFATLLFLLLSAARTNRRAAQNTDARA